MKWLLIPLLLIVSPAFADCPDLPDRSNERQGLLDDLVAANTYGIGIAAASAVWTFWHEAPDEVSQEMLDTGVSRLRIADYIEAESLLYRLAEYCPDYPEGHNQLAFAYFLQGKLEQSLTSIDRTLELEPAHFGALSGKAMIYAQQGRHSLAQLFLRRAVAVNPWLNERVMLKQLDGGDEL